MNKAIDSLLYRYDLCPSNPFQGQVPLHYPLLKPRYLLSLLSIMI